MDEVKEDWSLHNERIKQAQRKLFDAMTRKNHEEALRQIDAMLSDMIAIANVIRLSRDVQRVKG